jgi:hypothetical protein
MESKQEKSRYRPGTHVIYVDPFGLPRDALVTTWWGSGTPAKADGKAEHEPGCNLAWVSGDPARDDGYGRQIERQTSLVHKGNQPAHGNFWCWEDELSEEQLKQLNANRPSKAS